MIKEDAWLTYAKRIHALASSGLEFSDNDYELDRYQEIQALANTMLADLGSAQPKTIADLMAYGIDGYVTPKVDVRAAIIQNGKILLVQEKTDQRWALPGGYADVGLSAAENAEKEVWEEAGIKVRAKKLYAVRHKAKGDYRPDVRDFYKMFFMCQQIDNVAIKAGSEVMDAGYFSLDALPELSTGRVSESDIIAAYAYDKEPNRPTYYDGADFRLINEI